MKVIDSIKNEVEKIMDNDSAHDFEHIMRVYKNAQKYKELMPSVVGMSAMDAVALLENLQVNVKVKLNGNGVIKKQSVVKHQKLKTNQTIVLDAS